MLERNRGRRHLLTELGTDGARRGRRGFDGSVPGVDRREFLRGLSALGLSGATVSAGVRERSVPTGDVLRLHRHRHANPDRVRDGERPVREPVYRTVPVRDWVSVRAPWNAAEELADRLGRPAGLAYGVSYEGGDPRVCLHYDPSAGSERRLRDLERRVPDRVDGVASRGGEEYSVEDVPVSVEELRVTRQSQFGGIYRPVPGGCQISDSWLNRFTLGTPAWDTEANRAGWLTSGHCTDYRRDYWVFQPFGGAPVGKTTKVSARQGGDCAFVESAGPERAFDMASAGGGYENEYVRGALAADTLRDKVAAGEPLCVQGSTCSRCAGTLRGVLKFGGCEWVVFDELLTRGGDSGGPYFWKDDASEVYVAGINCGGVVQDGRWRTFGQTAYSVESQLDVLI